MGKSTDEENVYGLLDTAVTSPHIFKAKRPMQKLKSTVKMSLLPCTNIPSTSSQLSTEHEGSEDFVMDGYLDHRELNTESTDDVVAVHTKIDAGESKLPATTMKSSNHKKINGDKSVERVPTSKKLKLQTENDMIPNELRQQKQDNPLQTLPVAKDTHSSKPAKVLKLKQPRISNPKSKTRYPILSKVNEITPAPKVEKNIKKNSATHMTPVEPYEYRKSQVIASKAVPDVKKDTWKCRNTQKQASKDERVKQKNVAVTEVSNVGTKTKEDATKHMSTKKDAQKSIHESASTSVPKDVQGTTKCVNVRKPRRQTAKEQLLIQSSTITTVRKSKRCSKKTIHDDFYPY